MNGQLLNQHKHKERSSSSSFPGLWCLGPSKVISYLPAAKLREWRTAVPSFSLTPFLLRMPSLTSESRPAVSQVNTFATFGYANSSGEK